MFPRPGVGRAPLRSSGDHAGMVGASSAKKTLTPDRRPPLCRGGVCPPFNTPGLGSGWKHFTAWCRRQTLSRLLPDPETVGLYITACASGASERGAKPHSVFNIERAPGCHPAGTCYPARHGASIARIAPSPLSWPASATATPAPPPFRKRRFAALKT